MKTVNAVRLGAYASGVVGLVLVLAGRRTYPPSRTLLAFGGVLLVTMTLLFMAAYALYFHERLRRR